MKTFSMGAGVVVLCAALPACSEDGPPPVADDADRAETGAAQQPLEPAPADVSILNIEGSGTGCPDPDPGLFGYEITEDRKTLLVLFPDMQLNHPPGEVLQQRNCSLHVHVDAPDGWQFSLASIETLGIAVLPDKTWGEHSTVYSIEGSGTVGVFKSRFHGPVGLENYHSTTFEIPAEGTAWSGCGQAPIVSVDSGLKLNAAGAPADASTFANHGRDNRSRIYLRWQWRPC
jgi:hypothetical protein